MQCNSTRGLCSLWLLGRPPTSVWTTGLPCPTLWQQTFHLVSSYSFAKTLPCFSRFITIIHTFSPFSHHNLFLALNSVWTVAPCVPHWGRQTEERRGERIFIYVSDALTLTIKWAEKCEICDVYALSITEGLQCASPHCEPDKHAGLQRISTEHGRDISKLKMINITLCHRFRQIYARGWINLLFSENKKSN